MLFLLMKLSWTIYGAFSLYSIPSPIKYAGLLQQTKSGRTFSSYTGIPYAKPPVGDLRFRDPQKLDPMYGVIDATHESPTCIQKNYFRNIDPPTEGQEDCLYLNVYVPTTAAVRTLPVMVYIHWGGFVAGSSNSQILGAEYLMEKDVILVTFNYRLGIFGLLSTNDDASPGNFLFKDQVLALQWVNEHIEEFSGDKNRITIFGTSAGAGSVHYHMLSPLSKGLFHGAISESGTALHIWARPQNLLMSQIARQQAVFVGCNPNVTSDELVDCLRQVDATVLSDSVSKFKFFSIEPLLIYMPVTERQSERNPRPFITEDPAEIIKNKKAHPVPWIAGVTTQEGVLRTGQILRTAKDRQTLNQGFDTIAPLILGIPLSFPQNQTGEYWNKITDFYLDKHYVNVSDPDSIGGFTDLYSDRTFVYGLHQAAMLHTRASNHKVWVYSFGYRGEYTYGDVFAATKETIDYDFGVCHADELLYLFKSPALFPSELRENSNDDRMRRIMVQLWTNFATYHHPTPYPDCDLSLLDWEPIRNQSGFLLNFLNITGSFAGKPNISLRMGNHFYRKRMKFWTGLPLAENLVIGSV